MITCAACHATNRDDARFCTKCGSPLSHPAPPQAAASASASPPPRPAPGAAGPSADFAPRERKAPPPVPPPNICATCHAANRHDAHFCTSCGGALSPPAAAGSAALPPRPAQAAAGAFRGFFTGRASRPTSPRGDANRQRGPARSRAQMLRMVAKAGAKAIVKSLALSLAVLGPGFVLLFMGHLVPGMVWLFVGSFGMMAWTYRKPWRLGLIACLIPPVTAAACYGLQLWLFGTRAPPAALLGGAVAVGLAVGWWRAATHTVRRGEDGGIVAERTIAYLMVWALAYAGTQVLGMVATSLYAVRAGLVTGAFSTAMLATVSLVIWFQFRKLRAAPVAALILAVLIAMPVAVQPGPARADQAFNREVVSKIGATASSTITNALPGGLHPKGSDFFVETLSYPSGGRVQGVRRIYAFDVSTQSSEKGRLTVHVFIGQPQGGLTAEQYVRGAVEYLQATAAPRTRVEMAFGGGTIPTYQGQPITYQGQVMADRQTVMGAYRGMVVLGEAWFPPPSDGSTYDVSLAQLTRVAEAAFLTGVAVAMEMPAIGGSPTPAPAPAPQPGAQPSADGGDISLPGDRDVRPITPEEAAAIASAIAAVLIAAGIAANVAQALGLAIAQALQAGVEFTEQEIREAITEALLAGPSGWTGDGDGGGGGPEPPDSNAPPNVTSKERLRPPTPVYGPDGQPFPTNEDGQHQVTGPDGRPHWVSRAEAEAFAAEARRKAEEEAAKARARQAAAESEREAEAAQAAAERAAHEERERLRREQLAAGILNALAGLPRDEYYQALIDELAAAQAAGDTARLGTLWADVRGERQSQIDEWQRKADFESRRGQIYDTLATFASAVRTGAQVSLTAGIGGAVGGATVAPIAIAGSGMIVSGAIEEGLTNEDGEVSFDPEAAHRGGVRGTLTSATAMVGGVPANGSAGVIIGKTGFVAGVDAWQTYDDEYRKTGSHWEAGKKAATRFGTSFVTSGLSNAIGEAGNIPSKGGSGWREAFRATSNNKVVVEARQSAVSVFGNTVTGVLVEGKSTTEAFRDAVVDEALSKTAEAGIGRFTGGSSGTAHTHAPAVDPARPGASHAETASPSGPVRRPGSAGGDGLARSAADAAGPMRGAADIAATAPRVDGTGPRPAGDAPDAGKPPPPAGGTARADAPGRPAAPAQGADGDGAGPAVPRPAGDAPDTGSPPSSSGETARADAPAQGTNGGADNPAGPAAVAAGEQRPGITPDYADHLATRRQGEGTSIKTGGPGDYTHLPGQTGDVSGYTTSAQRHAQMVADSHGVQIYARPTSAEAADLISSGRAIAKTEDVKSKTGAALDIELGMDPANRGLSVIFTPEMPPRGDRSDAEWAALQGRYQTRLAETGTVLDKVNANPRLRVEGQLVIDAATGKPFAGDMDLFDVRGIHGERLPQAVVDRVVNDLRRHPEYSQVQHGAHDYWDYSGANTTKRDAHGRTEYEISRGIDGVIRARHTEEGGEALNVYTGTSGMGPPRAGAAFLNPARGDSADG